MKPIADNLADVIALAPQLSEEQWAARDVEIAERLVKETRSASAAALEVRREALLESGFPRRALRYAIAGDASKPALARLKSWDAGNRCVMLLSGPMGVGKTVAAAWWALHAPRTAAFVRASTFARVSRYERDGDAGKGAWIEAPALVLDDLGAEFLDSAGSFLTDLDELIDTFYADERALVITTNCNAKVFAQRYSERVLDRIRECGVFCEITGESMRPRRKS